VLAINGSEGLILKGKINLRILKITLDNKFEPIIIDPRRRALEMNISAPWIGSLNDL
jgi:hypothetical protein